MVPNVHQNLHPQKIGIVLGCFTSQCAPAGTLAQSGSGTTGWIRQTCGIKQDDGGGEQAAKSVEVRRVRRD